MGGFSSEKIPKKILFLVSVMYKKQAIMFLFLAIMLFSFLASNNILWLYSEKYQGQKFHSTQLNISDDDVSLLSSNSYKRVIKIKDVNISAIGHYTKFTWKISRNVPFQYVSFWGAIAINFSDYYSNSKVSTLNSKIYNIGVRDDLYEEVLKENLTLIFLSDYNGTHFTQKVIFMKGAVSSNTTFYRYQHNQINGSKIVYEEYNHTNIATTEVNSKYNPSLAIYNSVKTLKYYSNEDYLLVYIFLIPTNYLPTEISDGNSFSFTWVICYWHFNKYTRFSHIEYICGQPTIITCEIDSLYCVFVALNGSVILKKTIPISNYVVDSSNLQSQLSLIITPLVILFATIVIGIDALIKLQPRRKK